MRSVEIRSDEVRRYEISEHSIPFIIALFVCTVKLPYANVYNGTADTRCRFCYTHPE